MRTTLLILVILIFMVMSFSGEMVFAKKGLPKDSIAIPTEEPSPEDADTSSNGTGKNDGRENVIPGFNTPKPPNLQQRDGPEYPKPQLPHWIYQPRKETEPKQQL